MKSVKNIPYFFLVLASVATVWGFFAFQFLPVQPFIIRLPVGYLPSLV